METAVRVAVILLKVWASFVLEHCPCVKPYFHGEEDPGTFSKCRGVEAAGMVDDFDGLSDCYECWMRNRALGVEEEERAEAAREQEDSWRREARWDLLKEFVLQLREVDDGIYQLKAVGKT